MECSNSSSSASPAVTVLLHTGEILAGASRWTCFPFRRQLGQSDRDYRDLAVPPLKKIASVQIRLSHGCLPRTGFFFSIYIEVTECEATEWQTACRRLYFSFHSVKLTNSVGRQVPTGWQIHSLIDWYMQKGKAKSKKKKLEKRQLVYLQT